MPLVSLYAWEEINFQQPSVISDDLILPDLHFSAYVAGHNIANPRVPCTTTRALLLLR